MVQIVAELGTMGGLSHSVTEKLEETTVTAMKLQTQLSTRMDSGQARKECTGLECLRESRDIDYTRLVFYVRV